MSEMVKPERYTDTAPPDAEVEAFYAEFMAKASKLGLIVQAYGGVGTIAIPREQRKAGIRQQVLSMGCLNETEQPL